MKKKGKGYLPHLSFMARWHVADPQNRGFRVVSPFSRGWGAPRIFRQVVLRKWVILKPQHDCLLTNKDKIGVLSLSLSLSFFGGTPDLDWWSGG